MNSLQQIPQYRTNEYREALREFSADFDCTHAATLNFTDDCQNARDANFITNKLIRRFNREVFGSNLYEKKKAALSSIFVLQDGYGAKSLHLHAALGNFGNKWNDLQLLILFEKSVHATKGLKREEWYFQRVNSQKHWKDYIVREALKQKNEYCLFDLFSTGIAYMPTLAIQRQS